MTHRIMLTEAVIDVPADAFDATREFWTAAVRADARPFPGHDEFTQLVGGATPMRFGLQRLDSGAPRVHLDIESDDVAAEVERLIALGAQVVARPHSWVILRDPAGLDFCVVPADAESPRFREHSREVG
jgi:Glyoxalase-like domain